MGKYYAVVKGKSGGPFIFQNWNECKEEVIGFKGAIYKSFPSKQEAENFIDAHKNFYESNFEEESYEEYINIYVDGSFSEEKRAYAYGFAVVKDDNILYKENGVGMDESALAHRNIAGEILAVESAIKYCIDNNLNYIRIFHDYQGLSCWALGTWNRNTVLTKKYYDYMQKNMKKININFVKVKGHSGDKYNDLADKLAKEALGNIIP